MMKHDIASPSSMLVNEECFSRRLGRTSGYREALNLTRESRIDGDPFLWRRCWSTRKSFYPKDCEISSTLLRSFVRGIGRKFKILDIISFLNLSFWEISERFPPKFIPEEGIVPKIIRSASTCHESVSHARGRSGRKHYLRDRYEFTSTRADLDLDPGARVEGWDGDRCGTIPYISGGRFMEIRSAVSSRYNDRWPRYDRAVAPVPYVSLGVPPSTTYARPRRVRICGSLAGAPLNMEESGEITIRRVRSGLRTRISLSCKLLSLRGLLSLPV